MKYENEINPETAAFIKALPKAELHVHLEGSTRPLTLLELARRHNVELPFSDEEGVRRYYTFRNFDHFIEIYITIVDCIQSGEDFELITHELGAEAARQNTRYLEVTFTPYSHVRRKGLPWDEIIGGVASGVERVRREYGVQMRLITDIPRECYSMKLMEGAEQTAEWAVSGKGQGVVALGLGGGERGNPPEAFAEAFDYALRGGLHSIPHAGEILGPESIWGALRVLRAERIGHGIRCVDDPALVDYLREHRVPLEVCPTSNVCLGAVPSLEAHPVRRLYDAGLYITLNSDDPPMFNTTLLEEYMLLAARFGFSREELAELSLNAVRAALLPAEERERMEGQFRGEISKLLA